MAHLLRYPKRPIFDLLNLIFPRKGVNTSMLHYALIFLIIALVAAALGVGGLAGMALSIAKILLIVFVVLFLISVISNRGGPSV